VPGQTLGKARAMSLDRLTYKIQQGNIDDAFEVDSTTGIVTAKKRLDAEERNKYTLIVKATDYSERVAVTSIDINVVNENDEDPVFQQAVNGKIEVVLDRDSPIGSLINAVATDKDVVDLLSYKLYHPDFTISTLRLTFLCVSGGRWIYSSLVESIQ
jgi:hypothetical protein